MSSYQLLEKTGTGQKSIPNRNLPRVSESLRIQWNIWCAIRQITRTSKGITEVLPSFVPSLCSLSTKLLIFLNICYVLVLTAMPMEFRRNARVLINWHRIGLFRPLIDAVMYRILLSLIFLLCVMVRTNELLFPWRMCNRRRRFHPFASGAIPRCPSAMPVHWWGQDLKTAF